MSIIYTPPSSGSGGASLPSLPVWEYLPGGSGTPGPGQFTSDNPAVNATTILVFNPINDYGTSGVFLTYVVSNSLFTTLTLTREGKPWYFALTAVSSVPGGFSLSVSAFDIGSWIAGDHQMSFAPRATDITIPNVLANSLPAIVPVADNSISLALPAGGTLNLLTTQGILTGANIS